MSRERRGLALGLGAEAGLVSRLMWLLVLGLVGREKVVNIGRARRSISIDGERVSVSCISGSIACPLSSLTISERMGGNGDGLGESERDPNRNISSSLYSLPYDVSHEGEPSYS